MIELDRVQDTGISLQEAGRMSDINSFLKQYCSSRRQERMASVLQKRTRYISLVLEDIYQAQNASAALRHCDALGIQNIHIIENRNPYKTDDNVALGTAQWLDIERHNKDVENTLPTLRKLKACGYRIVATSPREGSDVTPETLNLEEGPVAIVMGNEKEGITEKVSREADVFLRIPMFGFVESLNISASVAIILHVLTRRLRNSHISWALSHEEKEALTLQWLQRTVPHAQELQREYELKKDEARIGE